MSSRREVWPFVLCAGVAQGSGRCPDVRNIVQHLKQNGRAHAIEHKVFIGLGAGIRF